jgi:hypothetical protein
VGRRERDNEIQKDRNGEAKAWKETLKSWLCLPLGQLTWACLYLSHREEQIKIGKQDGLFWLC